MILAIDKDYPADLGKLRRVKQISVTLPALTGSYQNIRAVLNYASANDTILVISSARLSFSR